MQRIAGFLKRGGVVVVVAIVAVGGLWATKQDFGLGRNMEIMVNLMRELSLQYVDEVAPDKLMKDGAAGMVRNLDPYTTYMSESEMNEFEVLATGKYGGIGATIRMKRDSSGVVIAQPYKGSPSDKAGLKIGDKFVSIDGEDMTKATSQQISSKLKGTPGTKVKLSVERVMTGKVEEFEIERARIAIPGVPYAGYVSEGVGYIRHSDFTDGCYDEMRAAVERLRSEGELKGLILDYRDNGGGSLPEAVKILSMFVPKDSKVVTMKGRTERSKHEYITETTPVLPDVPMVVLINGNSASASEIVCGALQDMDRAVLMGQRSFGKGLVQQQVPYADGSALRLTIARYYTPTGRSIQKPYENGHQDEYDMDIVRRYDNNEFFSADSIHFADSLKFTTPKGKVVYGGGGIMPDVFIPMDTLDMTKYYMEVSGRNILYRYTIEYADKHRAELNKVETIADLKALLDADKNLLNDFVQYAAKQGVKPVPREIARSRKIIESQLRAYIGRNTVLEDNGFYSNIIPIDNVLLKSIDMLEQPTQDVNKQN